MDIFIGGPLQHGDVIETGRVANTCKLKITMSEDRTARLMTAAALLTPTEMLILANRLRILAAEIAQNPV